MRSPGSAGRTRKRPRPRGDATEALPHEPNGGSSSPSGEGQPSSQRAELALAPPGSEVRTKEWAGRVRRYYSEKFCPAVNHPADPLHFPCLRWSARRTQGSAEDDLSLRVRDDPDHPATRVVRAIKELVRGEEDEDWGLYEAGARYLLLMLGKYPLTVDPALHIGCPTPVPPGGPAGGDRPRPRPQPHRFPTVRFGFEDPAWVRLNLTLAVSRDAPWNSSAWLLQETIRYELFYKGRLLRLGVCHNPACERLYVKAKHAGSVQIFCNRACGDAAHRHR